MGEPVPPRAGRCGSGGIWGYQQIRQGAYGALPRALTAGAFRADAHGNETRRSTMRILMLGNSLTSAQDMPDILAELTGAEVVCHTRGGARLSEHLNPNTRLGARTQGHLQRSSGTMWCCRK